MAHNFTAINEFLENDLTEIMNTEEYLAHVSKEEKILIHNPITNSVLKAHEDAALQEQFDRWQYQRSVE